MEKISVYNYFDYCDYLQDYYDQQKSLDKSFSHRKFLQKVGISGSVYLYRILKRERILTLKYADNFSKVLDHNTREARYFKTLIRFQNEKKQAQKEKYLRQLLSLRYTKEEFKLKDKKLKFYEKWYYAPVRELVVCLDFKDDYNKLANFIRPRITPDQAESAVRFLLSNGFIKKDQNGKYVHTDSVITTGPEVDSSFVLKYHKNNLLQCAEIFDAFSEEERDISSVTLSVSKKTFKNIKEEIRGFRKRLLHLATQDEEPELTCLVAFQLLPRSKFGKSGENV
jgi:uncharacterized protein (TIGR02147 family)